MNIKLLSSEGKIAYLIKPILKLVGHGIAMGNAIEEIKEIADDITDTVDNDGISKAFKKYFNI